jgi:hypothetical protein
VVDVSVDAVLRADGGGSNNNLHHHAQNGGAAGYMGCRLLPTGCIVQDMNNGYSKVRARTSSFTFCAPPGRYRWWWPALVALRSCCSTAVRSDCL